MNIYHVINGIYLDEFEFMSANNTVLLEKFGGRTSNHQSRTSTARNRTKMTKVAPKFEKSHLKSRKSHIRAVKSRAQARTSRAQARTSRAQARTSRAQSQTSHAREKAHEIKRSCAFSLFSREYEYLMEQLFYPALTGSPTKPPRPLEQSALVPPVRHKTPISRFE